MNRGLAVASDYLREQSGVLGSRITAYRISNGNINYNVLRKTPEELAWLLARR